MKTARNALLVVGMALLLVGACSSGQVSQPPPSGSEVSPTAVASKSPRPTDSGVEEPSPSSAGNDCDPEDPTLIEVGGVPREGVPSPFEGAQGQAIVIDPGSGNQFQIAVFAAGADPTADGGPIDRYFDALRVCFQVIPGDPLPGTDPASVEPADVTLLATILSMTDLRQEDLAAERERLMQAGSVPDEDGQGLSLWQVLEGLGHDPQPILDAASATVLSNIASAGLDAEQAADLTRNVEEEKALQWLLEEPEATIVTEQIDDPARLLLADPENLAIELEWLNADREQAVQFYLDPVVLQGANHYYGWTLTSYATTSVKATTGKVCDRLYRVIGSIQYIGVRCASAGTTTSSVTSSPGDRLWHRAKVTGILSNAGNGNQYSIYGSWRT